MGYFRLPCGERKSLLSFLFFKELAEITPVVLLPSERLPGPIGPPIIVLLW